MISKGFVFSNHLGKVIVLERNIAQFYPSITDSGVFHIKLHSGKYYRAKDIEIVKIDISDLHNEAAEIIQSELHV